MNEFRIFENPEFGSVRTAMIEGEIHFAGTDVAKALGYSIPSKAVQTHCHNVLKWKVGVKTGVKADGTDAIQQMEMLFIPESESSLVDGATERNSVGCIFALKANYGYTETPQRIEITGANAPALSQEDIRQIADQARKESIPELIEGLPDE